MGNKMQTYKQCSIKLEIGVNGVISQPAILGSIQSEALIQFFKQSEKSVSRKLTIKLELNNDQRVNYESKMLGLLGM